MDAGQRSLRRGKTWSYRHAGLRIASGLELPEWRGFERPGPFAHPDVRVELDAVLPHPPETPRQAHAAPGEYRFAIPDVGEFLVRDGRTITVRPAPGAPERALHLFLLGRAWGALCLQRGVLALHGSAVRVDDRVVALCGPSGAGKSSLAAGLVARGGTLVADDLCCVDLASGSPRVHPGAPHVKLWRDALGPLGWREDGLTRDLLRQDKFHAVLPRPAPLRSPLPLRAICILAWGEPRLTRLTGLAALQRLVASATYRPELVAPSGCTGPHWERCAQLVRSTPTWELRRRRDWDAAGEALDLVVASLGADPGRADPGR